MKEELPNNSDKELDDFFREKASKPNIPYDPADWDKMKTLLDQQPVTDYGGRWKDWYKGLFLPLGILVILTGLWLGGIRLDAETDEKGSYANVAFRSVQKENKEESVFLDSARNSKDREALLTEANPERNPVQISHGNTDNEQGFFLREKENAVLRIIAESGDNNIAQESEKPGNMVSEKFESRINRFKEGNSKYQVQSAKPLPILFKTGSKRFVNHLEPSNGMRVSHSQEITEKEEFSRFSISLLLAPDVSALKIKDIHGLGSSIGFNLEYFVQKNISINTGALYAFKTYRGIDGYDTGYAPSPIGIQGNCWIMDLPLNIRYYAIQNELDRWFISTGMSTYLMLREKYELEYRSYGNEPYTERLEVKNNNWHYWGIVNFSAGYERILSDRFSLQVEPYLKLPISGVGEGEVNLKSAGALIGLKYRW